MFALFKKFGKGYDEYMTRQGRRQARRILLSQSDSILDDLGISRQSLESGVAAWPWKATEEQPVPAQVRLSCQLALTATRDS